MDRNLPANAGDMGMIPGLGTFHMLPNGSAHAPHLLEPARSRALKPQLCPQLLKSMCPEPVIRNQTSHHSEKPMHCIERAVPILSNYRKPTQSSKDPQPKIKYINKLKTSKNNFWYIKHQIWNIKVEQNLYKYIFKF